MNISYRPEIDGMRSVAVLSVLIYHLEIPNEGSILLSGGFLGVDIFFVLSGYLITRIIMAERAATGQFSIADFYWRRARRILPPLLLVMLCTIPFAFQLLLPSEIDRFALSLLTALGFVSNLFWFLALGDYGAQAAGLQPFLHSWSLAIEEQFYLVFPLVMILLMRRCSWHWMLAILAVFLFLSLGVAQLTTALQPDLSFFSPFSRAWELLAGVLLAVLSVHRPDLLRGSRAGILVPPASVVVIAICFWTMELDAISHPGFATLPVILATCGILWFATPDDPVTRALSSAPMVFIGKLSYSLYLWHFPIFAFGRLSSLTEPTLSEHLVWIALTFGLSITGYYLVERPFRFRLSTASFAGALAAAGVAICGFAVVTSSTELLSRGRMDEMAAMYGPNDFDNERLKMESWSILDGLTESEEIGTWNAKRASRNAMTRLWFKDPEKEHVLIVGNSHSKDLFNSLHLNARLFPNKEFARYGLDDDFPPAQLNEMFDAPNFIESDVILIAPQYDEPALADMIPRVIDAIAAQGKRVGFVGNTAEFVSPGTLPVFDWYLRQAKGDVDAEAMNHMAYTYEAKTTARLDKELRRIAKEMDVPFLSRRSLICNDGTKTCTLMTPVGRKALYDYGHWTLDGAQYFGRLAAEKGWLTGL